jgi:hypothetical protein
MCFAQEYTIQRGCIKLYVLEIMFDIAEKIYVWLKCFIGQELHKLVGQILLRNWGELCCLRDI